MPTFALLIPPELLAVLLHRPTERSPTTADATSTVRRFGGQLEPRYIFGALQLVQ